MKKFLTLTLLCFLSVMAWGASSGTVGNYAYSFNDDYTATISGFGYGVSGITEMEIPETVTYSGDEYTVTKISHDMCNAPGYYSAILTEVIIPKSIVEIGYRAFNGQTSLSTIYCYAEEVPELTSSNGIENVFNNVTATVYVPAASVSAYQEAWGAKYSGLTFVALDGDTGDSGDHEGDYLTPEIMGFDLSSSSKQTIESFIGPSGTDYGAYCYAGSGTFVGDFNISAAGDYIRNNSSVGYLRELIIEPDENYTDSYVLPVRVAHEPYTGSSYSAFSSYGELVAEIVVKDGGTVELTDDYEYFAVGTANNWSEAKRFKSIELIWETEGGGDTGGSSNHEYSIEPSTDEVQSSLQNFTFTSYDGFMGNDDWYAEYIGSVSIYKDGSTEPYATTTDISGDWDSNISFDYDIYLYINFENEITEPGEYELVIPAGLFNWFNDDNPTLNEEMRFSYTVEGSGNTESGSLPDGYTVDPAEGEVPSLSVISLDTEGGLGESQYFYDETKKAEFKVVNDETGETVATLKEWEIMLDETTWHAWAEIRLSNEVSEAGSYTVTIPEGVFLDATDYNYDANPAFTLHYTVIGGSDTGGVTHHENDYLTPEIMGFDLASSSKQTIESFIGPSGTDYGAYCYVGVLNEGTGIDYTGDFNISGAGDYIRNNESVGYLRQLIIEPDENYTSDYVLPVRVAHEPYTGSSYSAFSEYGELVAEIVVKEGGSVELSDDYEYFAVGTANNWSEAKRFKSIELVWEVEGAAVPQVTFDPESGSSHSELSEFTVICEEGLGFNEKNAISITRDGEELDIYVNAWEITDGIKTTMDFSTDEWGDYPTSLTEAGTYVITIPAGFFILGNDKVESKKLSVTYIIEGSEVVEPTGSYSYVVDPEEGQVESLSYIELTSDDENVDGFLGNYEYALYTQEALVYSMYERGDPITTATLASGGELDDYDSSIIITLKDEITDPGSYRVVIPEGSFYWIVNDEPILNEEIDLSYYIEAPQGEYSYDPADGETLSSLSEFSVYYEDGGIDCSRNYVGYITVYDENGNYITNDADCVTTYPEDDPWGDGLYCTITLSTEITAEGKYTITIPEGYFIVGDNYLDSKELVITYTVSVPTGINGISINDENVEGIYSVGGQKLNKTQKGVNIIRYNDGSTKKVLISK